MSATTNLWACPFSALLSFLTGRPLVALIDMDGEVTVRIARRNVFGELTAERMAFNISPVRLMPDGSVRGASYVSKWVLLRGNAAVERLSEKHRRAA